MDPGTARLALACAELGVFEIEPAARAVRLDRRGRELLGVTPDGEVDLEVYLAVIDVAHRDRVAARLRDAAAGDAYHDEFRTGHRRWLAADGRAVAEAPEAGIVVVGVIADVTLRRTTEDARARMVDEMARRLVDVTHARVDGQLALEVGDADPAVSALAHLEPAEPARAMPLRRRAPESYGWLVERHRRLLALSLERRIYGDAQVGLAAELRGLADHLGAIDAGASDVAELHSDALQAALRGAAPLKAQALVHEGRLLALELMGRLLTFYRARAGVAATPREERLDG